MPQPSPLLKGTLDVLVLKALAREAMHGFEITVWLEERSDGQLAVDDGALYQSLHRMEARRLLKADWGVTDNNRRARYYSLTPSGRTFLRAESGSVIRSAQSLMAILGDARA